MLIRLYHERWEHEVTYLAPRHTLLTGRVLRSHDPAWLQQEIWALLTLYQALCLRSGLRASCGDPPAAPHFLVHQRLVKEDGEARRDLADLEVRTRCRLIQAGIY